MALAMALALAMAINNYIRNETNSQH